ncbi:MAG: hypothetical protein FJ143_08710, partial [Deltaproteobacteria bacterium]|nr:hypothetical protein [Deltaproteobacteria bacterium]
MFKSSTVKAIIFVLGGIIAGYLIFFDLPTFSKRNEVTGSIEHMNREAAQLNRSLPSLLDKETELTITEGADRMLIYKYRLINVAVGRLDHERFAAESGP